MPVKYTVLTQDHNYIYAKQGCCGGTIRIPVSYGLVVKPGNDIKVQTERIKGLDVHRVLIDGSWVEV